MMPRQDSTRELRRQETKRVQRLCAQVEAAISRISELHGIATNAEEEHEELASAIAASLEDGRNADATEHSKPSQNAVSPMDQQQQRSPSESNAEGVAMNSIDAHPAGTDLDSNADDDADDGDWGTFEDANEPAGKSQADPGPHRHNDNAGPSIEPPPLPDKVPMSGAGGTLEE